MNDLEDNLLGRGKKQSKEYKRRIEECENKVKMLRNKNNELQKQCDNELDSDVRQAIKAQGEYLEVATSLPRKKSGRSRRSSAPSPTSSRIPQPRSE
jgi:predicted RNase H-like nuclease (RuvC/YqgF family)